MACLIRAVQRSHLFPPPSSLSSSSFKTLVPFLQRHHYQHQHSYFLQSQTAAPPFLSQTRAAHLCKTPKSPFESNVLRILRNEIEYQNDYAPPQEPVTKFNAFTVQDWPGERWIRLTRKYRENEDIKIEVTMFDGCVMVPKPGDNSDGQDVRLHLSLIVDITKGEITDDAMEFICSAWPDCLEIRKAYALRRNQLLHAPCTGPDFKNMDGKVQSALEEFLQERGVNDELSIFLHEYMSKKDRIELIRWLGLVKSFVEK